MRPPTSGAATPIAATLGWLGGALGRTPVAAAVVLVGALIVRSIGLSSGFELWVDEMRYADLARSVSNGELPNLADGPFFLHPPGFFLLGGVVIRLFGLSGDSMTLAYDLRWLNAVIGAGSVTVAFLLVRRTTNVPIGWVVAAVLTFEPFVLRNNSRVLLETLGVFAALCGLLIIVAQQRASHDRPACWLIGGLFLGYAVLTKDFFVVVAVLPIALAVVWRRTLGRRQAVLILGGVALPYALYLIVLVFDGTIDQWWRAKFNGILRMIGITQSTGFNAHGSPSLLGRLVDQVGSFAGSYLLLALCPIVGFLAALSARADRRLIGLAALSFGLFGVYSAVFGTFEENYGYAVLVFSVLALAVCVAEQLARQPGSRRWVVVAAGLFLLVTVATGMKAEVTTDDGLRQVRNWVSANLPADARVAVTNNTSRLAFEHDPIFGVWPTAPSMEANGVDFILTSSLQTSQGYSYTSVQMLAWLAATAQPVVVVDGPTTGMTVLWSVPPSSRWAAAQAGIGDK